MTETRFCGYIATSVDGYIADRDGGIDWLTPRFDGPDYGYDAFYGRMAATVMGRTTFDQALGFGAWPYADKPTWVLSSRELPADPPPGVRFAAGPVNDVAAAIAREVTGDVWVVGGGVVLRDFLQARLLASVELFVIPVVLGRGVPLFPSGDYAGSLRLSAHQSYSNGVVRLLYEWTA